jgi:hypothetical protein
MTDAASPEIVRSDAPGKKRVQIGTGWFLDADDAGRLVLAFADSQEMQRNPDKPIQSYDGEKWTPIGTGKCPRRFANGKVLYFSGTNFAANLWEPGTGISRQIEAPRGYKLTPARVSNSNKAAIGVLRSNDPKRRYDIYLFDAEKESFQLLYREPN